MRKKNFKYDEKERLAIYKEHDTEVRKIIGYMANIGDDTEQKWVEDLREKASFTAVEIERMMKYFDNHLKGISAELGRAGDYNNPLNKQRIEDLWKQRSTYIDAKITLNKIHGIRATKEIEQQLKYNLDQIKETVHDQLTETEESLDTLDEFLRGNESPSMEHLEREERKEENASYKLNVEKVNGIEKPRMQQQENPEAIEKRVEFEERTAGDDYVTPIPRDRDYKNWAYVKEKSKRRMWKLQQND